jgi:hypothetical protein
MINRNKSSLWFFLFLFIIGFWIALFTSSCGKVGVSAAASNVQYQIVNLSPDLGSVDLYINYIKVNTNSYFYPRSSGYFYLPSLNTPFQIRPGQNLISGAIISTSNIFSLNNILSPNVRYTLFITGLKRVDSVRSIFTVDTAILPTAGRGKVRFINASPRSQGFDVGANGTLAFSNQQYLNVSKYIELPAGIYNFQIFPTGNSATILSDMRNVTIQDGRLYTLYSYGLVGHTDSLAFGASMITNK